MAGTKKSSSKSKKKTTAGSRSRTKARQEEASFIRSEVLNIAAFALAVLLFLSNFRLCGTVGEYLRQVQLGIFGIAGFVAPLLLFAGTCFGLANKGNPLAAVKLGAAIAGFLVICALAEMVFGGGYQPGQSLGQIYLRSSANGAGGGFAGGLLVTALGTALGTVGTYLVLVVALVICAVCVTEKSVVSAVKKGGGKAYRRAKEDAGRRRELHEERKEEKRRLREEQRVRGVNLDSTDLSVPPEFPEEVPMPAEEIPEPDAAPEEDASAVWAKEDTFTGRIQPMQPYIIEEDDDRVPFEEEGIPESVPEEAAEPEEEPVSQPEETLPPEEFSIPSESRQVVTAGGKIIESDTEALRKKLESRRQEAREEAGIPEPVSTEEAPKREYQFPPLSLLKGSGRKAGGFSDKEYRETAVKLQQTLRNFGVGVTVTNVSCGPAVTRYELHPEQGVKVSKIVGLADDIKLSLAASDIRIEAPIPGKSAVGIEVPNRETAVVYLRDLLETDEFKNSRSQLTFAVGRDIGGKAVVTDISKMPHLLIAGATGSGKSVCINTLIMSLIYKSSPEEVRMIMIDPKVVELSAYNGIPHLLIPVVTDPKKASGALNWAVAEMMDRYKKFAKYNVRDMKGYNTKAEAVKDLEDPDRPRKMPHIVIIVDELADLMMVSPGEVEDAICRLAQLARAAGIHLVIATQRPSVNVITGLIKANVPSRIAFAVSSGVDSRTIIDINGAEKLLGKGDMLFYPAGYPKPQRVQGAFVSDQEVSRVVEFLTEQNQESGESYSQEIESQIAAPAAASGADARNSRDEYFEQAGRFLIEKEKGSIGMLQRMFKIGFNRAARIMDQLAEAGVVGEEEGTKPRRVLMTMEEFEAMLKQ